MTTIPVRASKQYNVLIGDGLIRKLSSLISDICLSKKIAVITDNIVDRLYADQVNTNLTDHGYSVVRYVFPNGEDSKNITTFASILEFLAENDFKRNDTLIALGGGVVGDITGFAASVYMRGIDFIQIPTTLLAAVDASVGGKTAVDLSAGKNLAGTFWQPRIVICDSAIIHSLPFDIFGNGMAEVIKHGVINGTDILHSIENDGVMDNLEWVLKRNVEIKRDVVENDERENGIRRFLNFGHTIAHAIEKASDYSIPHGIAVGTGMVYEAKIAYSLGMCGSELVERIKSCCQKYQLHHEIKVNKELVSLMKHDKKNKDDNIVFALPESIGKMKIIKLSQEDILQLMNV
ncbi:MAG: 3-dehydroquinate synthase [Candidatus Izemoplasmatales bacterium]